MWVPRHKHKERKNGEKDNTAGRAKRNVSGFLVESVPSRTEGGNRPGKVVWAERDGPEEEVGGLLLRRFGDHRRKIRGSRMHEL